MILLKEETTSSVLDGGGSNSWARVCDTCRLAACTVYCRADSAYLCSACDARIHAANRVASRHERVWVCEACERAPAAFLCKADAASLCTNCDADIHSANPLARRHHRVPILPIPGCLYGPGQATDVVDEEDGLLAPEPDHTMDDEDEDEDEEEAASWLLLNPAKNNNNNNKDLNSNGFLFGGEAVDEYLDLVEYNSCPDQSQLADQQYRSLPDQKSYGGDSVVPVQCGEGKSHLHQQQHQNQQQHLNYQLEMMEYESSKAGYGYPASHSHSVSVSSMDVGIVPESTMSDVSVSHSRPPKGTIDHFSSPLQMPPTQLAPMDREARVMRYREKKKNRKFEKTIRYASRKAYAETRPRIKGRFAKRRDAEEVEVDHMFSTALMVGGGYGVVPSF